MIKCLLPHSKIDIEKKLGIWCFNIKRAKKSNKLDQEKINILEQIKEWSWSK